MSDTTNYLIISAICGVLMAVIKVMYDSKCVKIKLCCGLAEIERDIEEEIKHDEHTAENEKSPQTLRFAN